MKKILILAGVLCSIGGAAAHAATGDVADHIYSTDIRAFINGIEVQSYAIDGKTVVVVEDVTEDYSYNDDFRTLLIGGFNPEILKSGSAEHSDTPGNIIGDVYETDIKTYIYDVEIPAYALNGKTAVALEDLGADQAWSETGGKYKWDSDARTISLDFLYDHISHDILYDNAANIRFTINDELSEINAEFYFDKLSVGGGVSFENVADKDVTGIIPVMTEINGEKKQLGVYFTHGYKYFDIRGYDMGNGEIRYGGNVTGGKPIYIIRDDSWGLCSLDDEILAQGAAAMEKAELTPADEVLKEYIVTHACSVHERFDTDDYTFAYLIGSTPHGGTGLLILIQPDGTYYDYSNDFESVSMWGTKFFEDVKIDRENEKVYFRYDTDYVIDLKTGKLEKAE